MTWRETYDTEHCPRCGRTGLRYAGYFEEGKSRGTEGGDYWSCAGCSGWFSTIELKRRDPVNPTFKGRP